MRLTEKQKHLILNELHAVKSSGLAFAYQPDRKDVDYHPNKALAEIELILEMDDEASQ